MKTIEELYREVLESEELKKEFLTIKPEEVEGFAAKHGCKAGLDEIKAFFEAKKNQTGTLSDEELDQIAGGKGVDGYEVVMSTLGFGVMCVAGVLISATIGHVGTAIEEDHMLCGK